MSVLLGLATVVGGFVSGTGDDVDVDVGSGGGYDQCLTFLMAGTSQQGHWNWNVCFTWSGYSCWWYR